MALKLISPPASEPITLVEAKAHLRVTDSDNDTLITALIKAARANAEGFMGRALVDQTWELYLDSFPTYSVNVNSYCNVTSTAPGALAIEVPLPPLIQVTQIAYDDANGDEQIIASGSYYVDNVSEPGWVVPSGISQWPTPINAINSVRVRFRAGYLTNDSPADTFVPEDIKAAIKLILGSLYEHRETQVVGLIANELPLGVEQLLRRYRVLLGMA